MKKSELKKILKKLVSDTAFERLQKVKKNYSKVMDVEHYKLEMKKYLKAIQFNLKQEDAQMIYNLRSRMTEVKINYRGSYETFECEVCQENEESHMRKRIITEIVKLRKEYRKPPEYTRMEV